MRHAESCLIASAAIATLLLTAIAHADTTAPYEDDLAAYLLVYFKDDTHSIHFALSSDGYRFTDVNSGEPVIDGAQIAEQKGVRDPYLMRGPDGVFYMAATDLHIFGKEAGHRTTQWQRDGERYGWGNNRALVLLKSTDLIDWDHTVLRVDQAYPQLSDISSTWAPELIYDHDRGAIMLYYSSRSPGVRDRIYYCYLDDDFSKMVTAPEPLFEYPTEHTTIDGDITRVRDKFHLFYVPHDGTPGVKQAVSDRINGGYVYDAAWYDTVDTSCEAPNVWQRLGQDKWVLMYDIYGTRPHNFGFRETTDFKTFTDLGRFNDGPMKSTNFTSPKHGSVTHLTKAEADQLAEHWGLKKY